MTQSQAEQAALDGWSVETPVETARACVACGYNLFGLGDEPRCPECGLRNIPDEFRRQVWELVDSRKWFFSGPFSLFLKRLPGWWWALDRPGDLQRSLKVVARNAVVTAAIVFAGAAAASSIATENTMIWQFWNTNDPTARIIHETTWITRGGLIRSLEETVREPDWKDVWRPEVSHGAASTSRLVVCGPNWRALPVALVTLLWLALTWVGPVFVGLVTQIRKGLPKFARPPHTIIAAGAYESHRLIWAAASSALGLGLAGVLFALNARARSAFMTIGSIPVDVLMLFGVGGGVVLYVALGWVAPLRSDWTRQLIQSRGHAVRIMVMYALLLPLLTTWAVVMLVLVILGEF